MINCCFDTCFHHIGDWHVIIVTVLLCGLNTTNFYCSRGTFNDFSEAHTDRKTFCPYTKTHAMPLHLYGES